MDREKMIEEADELFTRYVERLKNVYIPLKKGKYYEPPNLSDAFKIYDKLVNLATEHLLRSGLKSVLVPASGGADSTFMLCILRDAADKLKSKHNVDFKVIGATLPCSLQDDWEILDKMGRWACELYADDFFTINLGPLHKIVMEEIFNSSKIRMDSGKTLKDVIYDINPGYPDKQYRIDSGNVAARLRMIVAYGYAKMLCGAPCSTDNLSEMLCGFWTLCGDEGTFKYIQNIWKGLEQPMIMKAAGIPTPFFMQQPTDGLGISSNDVEQLYGHLYTGKETYIDVDITLINFIDGRDYPDPLNPSVIWYVHPVCRLNIKTEFKRYPFCISRADLNLPFEFAEMAKDKF